MSTKTDIISDHGYGYGIERRQIQNTQRSRNRVMNIRNNATTSLLSMKELIAAVVSGEFDLDDTISMNATPFCQICMGSKVRASQGFESSHLYTKPEL